MGLTLFSFIISASVFIGIWEIIWKFFVKDLDSLPSEKKFMVIFLLMWTAIPFNLFFSFGVIHPILRSVF